MQRAWSWQLSVPIIHSFTSVKGISLCLHRLSYVSSLTNTVSTIGLITWSTDAFKTTRNVEAYKIWWPFTILCTCFTFISICMKTKPHGQQMNQWLIINQTIFNPRRACAARVPAVGFVCVSVTLNLTSRVFVRLAKDAIYLTGNEGQKICGVFSENAPLQS